MLRERYPRIEKSLIATRLRAAQSCVAPFGAAGVDLFVVSPFGCLVSAHFAGGRGGKFWVDSRVGSSTLSFPRLLAQPMSHSSIPGSIWVGRRRSLYVVPLGRRPTAAAVSAVLVPVAVFAMATVIDPRSFPLFLPLD